MKKHLLALGLLTLGFSSLAHAQNVANAYVFGQGDDGINYCYATDAYGNIPDGEQPVDRSACYSGRYAWVRASNGLNYCYPTDYNGSVASDEQIVSNAYCGAVVQVPIILPVFRPYHHVHYGPIIIGRPGPIFVGPRPIVIGRPGPIFVGPRPGEFGHGPGPMHGGPGFGHGGGFGGHGPHRLDSDSDTDSSDDTANNVDASALQDVQQ